ncbi:MAG: DUF6128 domain-containing protein [Eubacteriales bacterium]
MKQTICYLYAYEAYTKTKNVGFVKCIFQKDKVTFQIHGKGLDCDKFMDLEMFLFISDDEQCNVDRAGIVEGDQGKVDYMVTVEGFDASRWNGYDGVLLQSKNKKQYIATWKQKEVKITMEDIALEKKEEISNESECDEAQSENESECDEVQSENESECDEMQSENESECDEMQSENEPECDEGQVSEYLGINRDEVLEEYDEEGDFTEGKKTITIEEFTYEKIDRQGLSALPHREWKLANNNFLLHGYKNYKHLMFIRNRERLYLGVPGVYHGNEETAAKSFGFSLFHAVDVEQLKLDSYESDTRERFGYWCRPVTELRGMDERRKYAR